MSIRGSILSLTGAGLWLLFQSCTTNPVEIEPFHPTALDDGWSVSTAQAQGLDRQVLADGYAAAARLDYLYSMLVVRNGYLVAEKYFNGSDPQRADNAMSVSKSLLSALVGIAFHERYLDSLNHRVLDFFPEYIYPSIDNRKYDITIRHLLMMRAGIEKEQQNYFQIHNSSNWIESTIGLPLVYNPGEQMRYNTFQTTGFGQVWIPVP